MSTGQDNPAGGMPADAIPKAVAMTAAGSVKHLHYARLVSPACAQAAGLLVETLQCGPACDIPADIWRQAFPNAKGLRVDISKGSAQQRSHPIISELVEQVPEGRLKTFVVVASAPGPFQQSVGQAGMASQDVTDGERRLWGSAATSTIHTSQRTRFLEEVIITVPVSASDANGILTDLQRLQQLKVCIEGEGVWAPAAAEQLRALKLSATGPALHPRLDIAALKNCPLLEVLHLEGASGTNWEQVSKLVNLEELLVLDAGVVPLVTLAQLPELHTLLTDWDLQPEQWPLIAAMKKLATLKVHQAWLPATGPPSSSLTSLETTQLRTPEGGAKLSLLAPELQRLGVVMGFETVPTALHTAAQGHPKLQALLLSSSVALMASTFLSELLKSLPALEELEVGGVGGASTVLSAAAGCSRLRRLGFMDDAERACCTPWAGWAVNPELRSSSAAASLQSVQLGSPHAPLQLQEAAQLLRALRNLQQAVLYVQVLPSSEAPTSALARRVAHGLMRPWPRPLPYPPGDRQRARELCAWLVQQLRAAGCLVQADGEELQEVDRSVVLRGVRLDETWAARVTEMKLRVNNAAVRLCVVEGGPEV